jgi:hypothetical protein
MGPFLLPRDRPEGLQATKLDLSGGGKPFGAEVLKQWPSGQCCGMEV